MAKKDEKPEVEETETPETETPVEEKKEKKGAKVALKPGEARIKYRFDHYDQDWGAPTLHKQGDELIVDAEKAATLKFEYGPDVRGNIFKDGGQTPKVVKGEKITSLGCPFEIIETTKAAVAPETK